MKKLCFEHVNFVASNCGRGTEFIIIGLCLLWPWLEFYSVKASV
jgi:hypothetical protein